MTRTAGYGALLVALGVAVGIALGRRDDRGRAEPGEGHRGDLVSAAAQSLAPRETDGGDSHAARLERRLEMLAAKVAAEAEQRHHLEQQLAGLTAQLTALRPSGQQTADAAASQPAPAAAAPATDVKTGDGTDQGSADGGSTTLERALLAAGIDATTATEIRRRRDELALSEIYLRDQAAREGWHDTPRFAAEMAEIERQRPSIRDEIGDEAYDRYLAALDQPNRVAVNEVMLESPAAAAGLQAGDVVLRYGETRIFSPGELVTATRGGTAGENVQMQIIRQGRPFEITVPRGPLGVTIAASRGDPGEG